MHFDYKKLQPAARDVGHWGSYRYSGRWRTTFATATVTLKGLHEDNGKMNCSLASLKVLMMGLCLMLCCGFTDSQIVGVWIPEHVKWVRDYGILQTGMT